MKIITYLYEKLQKPKKNDNLDDINEMPDFRSEAESIKELLILIVYGVILITIILLMKEYKVLKNQSELGRSAAIMVISFYYLIGYIKLKEGFMNMIFAYKEKMMRIYYKLHKDKVDELKAGGNEIECNLVLVPSTGNGSLIGTLESLLYSIALILQSMTLIGVILGVRAYITVQSHPNKEESEFYIIGILGSLLYSILFTYLFVILLKSFFTFDILSETAQYLHISKDN